MTKKIKIAIVGSGISGLGLAYNLNEKFEITILEKEPRFGGHIYNVVLDEIDTKVSIDIGFMVFNKFTYPNFCNLIDQLRIETHKSDMSFGVSNRIDNIEWNGAGLGKIFGQRSNIFNLKFWSFLNELNKFNTSYEEIINNKELKFISIKEFIKRKKYSDNFVNWYLIPIAGAIWSITPNQILDFPIYTLYNFFKNHGFLGLDTHFQWYTIKDGTSSYLNKLKEKTKANFICSTDIINISETQNNVEIILKDSSKLEFDLCVIATHADTAIKLVNDSNRDILSKFKYKNNNIIIHKQDNVMPRNKNTWAAWNWRVDKIGQEILYSTHYYVNRLQNIKSSDNYYVSLNAEHLIEKQNRLFETNLSHPQFDTESIKAQENINQINHNENQKIYYCGSYFKYGFHEDAYTSGLELSKILNKKY